MSCKLLEGYVIIVYQRQNIFQDSKYQYIKTYIIVYKDLMWVGQRTAHHDKSHTSLTQTIQSMLTTDYWHIPQKILDLFWHLPSIALIENLNWSWNKENKKWVLGGHVSTGRLISDSGGGGLISGGGGLISGIKNVSEWSDKKQVDGALSTYYVFHLHWFEVLYCTINQ